MPFRSEAQRRFFHWAESAGKLPKGTTAKWQRHTPKKKLPEHVEPANQADQAKQADADSAPSGPPPNYRDAAGAVTTCGTCKFYDQQQSVCSQYDNTPVAATGTCDGWQGKPAAASQLQPDLSLLPPAPKPTDFSMTDASLEKESANPVQPITPVGTPGTSAIKPTQLPAAANQLHVPMRTGQPMSLQQLLQQLAPTNMPETTQVMQPVKAANEVKEAVLPECPTALRSPLQRPVVLKVAAAPRKPAIMRGGSSAAPQPIKGQQAAAPVDASAIGTFRSFRQTNPQADYWLGYLPPYSLAQNVMEGVDAASQGKIPAAVGYGLGAVIDAVPGSKAARPAVKHMFPRSMLSRAAKAMEPLISQAITEGGAQLQQQLDQPGMSPATREAAPQGPPMKKQSDAQHIGWFERPTQGVTQAPRELQGGVVQAPQRPMLFAGRATQGYQGPMRMDTGKPGMPGQGPQRPMMFAGRRPAMMRADTGKPGMLPSPTGPSYGSVGTADASGAQVIDRGPMRAGVKPVASPATKPGELQGGVTQAPQELQGGVTQTPAPRELQGGVMQAPQRPMLFAGRDSQRTPGPMRADTGKPGMLPRSVQRPVMFAGKQPATMRADTGKPGMLPSATGPSYGSVGTADASGASAINRGPMRAGVKPVASQPSEGISGLTPPPAYGAYAQDGNSNRYRDYMGYDPSGNQWKNGVRTGRALPYESRTPQSTFLAQGKSGSAPAGAQPPQLDPSRIGKTPASSPSRPAVFTGRQSQLVTPGKPAGNQVVEATQPRPGIGPGMMGLGKLAGRQKRAVGPPQGTVMTPFTGYPGMANPLGPLQHTQFSEDWRKGNTQAYTGSPFAATDERGMNPRERDAFGRRPAYAQWSYMNRQALRDRVRAVGLSDQQFSQMMVGRPDYAPQEVFNAGVRGVRNFFNATPLGGMYNLDAGQFRPAFGAMYPGTAVGSRRPPAGEGRPGLSQPGELKAETNGMDVDLERARNSVAGGEARQGGFADGVYRQAVSQTRRGDLSAQQAALQQFRGSSKPGVTSPLAPAGTGKPAAGVSAGGGKGLGLTPGQGKGVAPAVASPNALLQGLQQVGQGAWNAAVGSQTKPLQRPVAWQNLAPAARGLQQAGQGAMNVMAGRPVNGTPQAPVSVSTPAPAQPASPSPSGYAVPDMNMAVPKGVNANYHKQYLQNMQQYAQLGNQINQSAGMLNRLPAGDMRRQMMEGQLARQQQRMQILARRHQGLRNRAGDFNSAYDLPTLQ